MDSNRGPSAYQSNALPLGQTGSNRFEYIRGSGLYGADWLLYCCCYMKLLTSRCMFCAHNTIMHQFTVVYSATLLEATSIEEQLLELLHTH